MKLLKEKQLVTEIHEKFQASARLFWDVMRTQLYTCRRPSPLCTYCFS
jgi:hypothetical protein